MTREEESEPVASDGDAEEHREVYARFGLAYSLAECVHRGLVNVFAYLPYDHTTATRSWVEERDLLASTMTLGELATKSKPFLPANLHAEIDWAVERRNFLAHKFWYERSHEMVSARGRMDLVTFLADTADRLLELGHVLDRIMREHAERLGITPEQFREAVDEVRRGGPGSPASLAPASEVAASEAACESGASFAPPRGSSGL